MDSELYAILALAARYFFVLLMLLVVFRAWRCTVVDNRRAKLLRDFSPETGCIGEFIVNPKRGQKRLTVPVPREGVLGRSSRADVMIRNKSLRRMHAFFEQREGGLFVRPYHGATFRVGGRESGEPLFLRDGDALTVGTLKFLFVLFDAVPDAPTPDFDDENALWGTPPATELPENASNPSEKPVGKPNSTEKARALSRFEDELWRDE